MNNLSDSLHYSLGQYAALTQAQLFNPSSPLQPTPSQHALGSPSLSQQQTQQLVHREHISNVAAPASVASPHLIQDPHSAAITTSQFHLTTAAVSFQPYTFQLRMPPQRVTTTAVSYSPPLTQQQTTTTTNSITSPASSIHTTMTSASSVSPVIPATPSINQNTSNSNSNHSNPTSQHQTHFSNAMIPKMTMSSPFTISTHSSNPSEQCAIKSSDTGSKNNGPPVRVTRPPNAYLLFNKEMRKVLKEQNPTLKVAEISKEIGSRWKNLSVSEKDKYIKEADRLKAEQKSLHPNSMYIRRSRAELVKAGHHFNSSSKSNTFSPYNNHQNNKRLKRSSGSKKGTGKKYGASQQRDAQQGEGSVVATPPPPKHPLSAYMWYLTEVRPETMRNYPGSNVSQISKLCADQWHRMSEEARLPWQTKAQMDKERYAREMQIYAIQNDHTLGRGTRLKYRSAAAHALQAAPISSPLQQAPIMAVNDIGGTRNDLSTSDNLIEPLFYQTTSSPTPTMASTAHTPSIVCNTNNITNTTDTLTTPLLRPSLPFVQQQHTFSSNTHLDLQQSFNMH